MMVNTERSLLFEFIYVEASNILDEKERPLGESRASDDVKSRTSFEKKQCPYRDSRHQHVKPMNVSPLKLMTRCWVDILDEVSFIRELYLKKFDRSEVCLDDIWFLSGIGLYYPYFQMYKKEGRINSGEISIVVSSFYKVAIGMFQQFFGMFSLVIQDGKTIVDHKTDTEDIYGYVDDNGFLIGAAEVCAGPINLIKQIVDEMLGTNGPRATTEKYKPLLPEEEYDQLIDFTNHLLTIDLINRIYKETESYLFAKLGDILLENENAARPVKLLLEIQAKLKARRSYDSSIDYVKGGPFYEEVEKLVNKISKADEEVMDHLRVMIQEGTTVDSEKVQKTLAKWLEVAGDKGEEILQSDLLTIYRFVEVALDYQNREAAFVKILKRKEKQLRLALGHSEEPFDYDRRYIMDYNNYYFSEVFELFF